MGELRKPLEKQTAERKVNQGAEAYLFCSVCQFPVPVSI